MIGLVGGIGSGKSAVAQSLASRRNFVVIDADAIGHQVLKQPDTKISIKEEFGPDVFDEDGEIDRSRLAKRVFGSARDSRSARETLNQIVHPKIGEQIQHEIQAARERAEREPGSISGVLLDAAILLETGWGEMCNGIVYVDAPEKVRRQRVEESRGWQRDNWKQREASQLSLEAKKNAATVTIDNSQDLNLAIAELEEFLASQNALNPPSFDSDT